MQFLGRQIGIDILQDPGEVKATRSIFNFQGQAFGYKREMSANCTDTVGESNTLQMK